MATNVADARALTPDGYSQLIIEPLKDKTAALNPAVSTIIYTDTNTTHVPVLRADAHAQWVAEGQDISLSDPVIDEVIVTPAKIATLTCVSRELSHDSTPAALGVVGESIARDIGRGVDRAFFGNLPLPAPAGLGSIPAAQHDPIDQVIDDGHLTVEWGTGAAPSNLDAFSEAIAMAESLGNTVTAFVTSPTTASAIMKLRSQKDSNVPLLGADPTNAIRRQLLGVPLIANNAVEPGTVWAVDKSLVLTIMRQTIEVTVSQDAFFGRDSVALRAICRVGFAFPSKQSIIKIVAAAA